MKSGVAGSNAPFWFRRQPLSVRQGAFDADCRYVRQRTEAFHARAGNFPMNSYMAQEQQLMTTLSASRFGDDVLLVVDIPCAAPLL
jgi:hypothetical protein